MFMQTEPVGEERADWRFAVLSALFANANRAAQASPFAASDFVFMPEIVTARREAVAEETIEDIARAWGAL